MAFEIVPAPHLPPYVCMACGCANGEPHAFIPHNQAWEQAYPFICKPCVAEMAGALGITEAVEVPRPPTPEEIAAYIAEHPAASDQPTPAPIVMAHPGEYTPPDTVQCPCGVVFTGQTAKAKLGSHQRTCKAAKEAVPDAG